MHLLLFVQDRFIPFVCSGDAFVLPGRRAVPMPRGQCSLNHLRELGAKAFSRETLRVLRDTGGIELIRAVFKSVDGLC